MTLEWIVDLLKAALGRKKSPNPELPSAMLTAQGANVTESPLASGTNITQKINSPTTINLSLPAPIGAPGSERYNEWRELIDEIHESIQRMGWAFVDIVAHAAGDDRNDYQAGIRRASRALENRILIGDAIQKAGLKKDWDELVEYTRSGRSASFRALQPGSPTMGGFDRKAHEFQEKLVRVASEDMNAISQDADRPDIFIEWDSGRRHRHDKILFRNVGTVSAFNITVGEFSWSELYWHRNIEIQAIHPEKEISVEAQFAEKGSSGTDYIGYLHLIFNSRKYEDRAPLSIDVTFSDPRRTTFTRTFILRKDSEGSGVIVEMGEIKIQRATTVGST